MKQDFHTSQLKPGVFLVGCPRSGTTVLQSHLARHSGIVTFPESHFFDRMLVNRSRLRRLLGLPQPGSRDNLLSFAREIHCENVLSRKRFLFTAGQLTDEFESMLSLSARESGANVWLEKTPGHSHYINYIQRHIGSARFIHLIRDGKQVAASLYGVTRKHPEHWSGSWSLEQCVNRWRSAINDSIRYSGDVERHFVLFYEDLMEDPGLWLSSLLRFLGLDAGEPQLDAMMGGGAPIEGHVNIDEDWKRGAEQPFKASSSGNQFSSFTESDMEYLEREIGGVDLSALRASALGRCR